MWQRFTPYDLRVIGHYLGTLLLFFAALMALPLATALVFQEWEPAARYLAAIGIHHGRGLAVCVFCASNPDASIAVRRWR